MSECPCVTSDMMTSVPVNAKSDVTTSPLTLVSLFLVSPHSTDHQGYLVILTITKVDLVNLTETHNLFLIINGFEVQMFKPRKRHLLVKQWLKQRIKTSVLYKYSSLGKNGTENWFSSTTKFSVSVHTIELLGSQGENIELKFLCDVVVRKSYDVPWWVGKEK